MENYGFNYSNYPQNYQLIANSVSDIQHNYINNTMPNPYQFYDIKAYYDENSIQHNYKAIRYPQTIVYGNDLNLLNMQNDEDFYANCSKDIKKNIQKAPKDNFKMPKDSTKNKTNYDEINNYAHIQTNNKYNNITTINNNSYNKINSINIIFDANNIYDNDYIKYNNFNDIGLLENNYYKTINNENASKKESNFEKQPLDNYKNYTNSVNQMNNIINNDTLIRLNKSQENDMFDKDSSYQMPGGQNNFPKKDESNKLTNKNNIINNKANTIQNIKEEKKESKLNRNIEFSNKNSLNKNTINKIEKINNSKDSITSIKIRERRINKKLTSPQSHKNIMNIINNHKPANNDKTKEKVKERKNEKLNRKSNMLKQTRSYVDENKYHFLKRRNTYQNDELNKNFTFNSSLKNTKSKEKEKSNFAFLINEKKMKMLSSFKQINTFNSRSTYKADKSNYLSSQKNDIIYEKGRNMKGIEKYKHKTNNLEDQYKSSKSKYINNNQKYKEFYTPQLSNKNLIKNKTKEINNKKNTNFNKKKNKELTRNVSYNISFNSKKKNLFKKKSELSTQNTFTVRSSRNIIDNKFQLINKIEDSLLESNKHEKISSIILKTEHNEDKFVNSLFSEEIAKVNKCEENALQISERNIKKVFSQKTSDCHLKKGHINLDKNEGSKNVKSKKSYTERISINNDKTRKKYLSIRNSSEKKNIKKNDNKDNKITKMGKKKLFNSKHKDRSNSGIINQKKNLYSFNKKSQKKNLMKRYDIFSENKKDSNNISFRGFSAFKKLEEIKKKYKFRPQTKEKKISLKERNINYIEVSKGFAKFISFTNSEEDNSLEKDKIFSKNNKNNDANNDINNNNEKNNEENDIDKENDIINNKSFILDLNNVIPINDKELIDSVNKISITNKSIERNKFEKTLNSIDFINKDIDKEKSINEKSKDDIKIKEDI